MKSHLEIEANGNPLVLPEDFSMDIDFQNPMFNETEMFSYPVQIPTTGNRRLLKNIEDVNSDMRSVELEHTKTNIKVDGMPFCSGTMVMQDEEEVKDSVSMSVNAAEQSFQDLIGDLTCQDIPVKDRIVIGEKIGNLYVKVGINSIVTVVRKQGRKSSKKDKTEYGGVSPRYIENVFEPQALGFSYPGKCAVKDEKTQVAIEENTISYKKGHKVIKPKEEASYINVSEAYSLTTHYCNARVCYAHYALGEDGKTSDQKEKDLPQASDMEKGAEPENRGAYWLLDAKRQQSGICFYVLYFLDCLFDYLGVTFDKSSLLEIEDFKHLAFFTTHCKYDTEVLHHGARIKTSELTYIYEVNGYYVTETLTPVDGKYNVEGAITAKSIRVSFRTVRRIGGVGGKYYYQDTLTDNGDGTYSVNADSEIATDLPYQMEVQSVPEYFHYFFEKVSSDGKNLNDLFSGINEWCESRGAGGKFSIPKLTDKSVQDIKFKKGIRHGDVFIPTGEEETVTVGDGCKSITISNKIKYCKVGANIMTMLANSENFPAESVSTLIESLENAFGVKFDYNYEQRKVTAYLIRDLFRKPAPARELQAKVYDMVKVSEKITGVRMCYSSESSSKEQRDNVRKGTKDYDTDFDYIQYPDPETAKKGQTSTVFYLKYEDFYTNLSNSDMNVYVDRSTGNAYRIKIDSEYTDAASMKPVLFEVGQWKGMEYGDCSELNEDYVHEFSIGFTPISFNDVNYKFEVSQHEEMIGQDSETQDCYQVYGFNGMTFQPMLAAFVDEDMEHEFVEQRIDNALSCSVCDVLIRETLSLVESYDTTSTDDGNSPLQTYDWGMAIALMRGGGSNMTSQEYDYNYDGFGNAKWQTVVGEYALCSDTMDAWGNVFDYNGDTPGTGAANGSYNGTYTKEEAKQLLLSIYYQSNADLIISSRKVTALAMRAKGWTRVSGDDYCTVYSQGMGFDDGDGKQKEFLVTPIQDNGQILSPVELETYMSNLEELAISGKTTIMSLDATRKKIVIAEYYKSSNIKNAVDACNYYAQVLQELHDIYYGNSTSVSVPTPSTIFVAYNSKLMECFSLKINADKTWLAAWAQERGISLCNDDIRDEQGNVTTKIRSRGLWQTFMIDYAYYLLHRKKYNVRAFIEAAQLADIKNHWKEWWIINGKRCLINKVQCNASLKNGLGESLLEVYSM